MINNDSLREAEIFATQIRLETVKQIGTRGFGHVGGSMSIADLISVLYSFDMNYNPHNPKMETRDYLICSKGHAGPAIYAALGLKGFFPMSWMNTLNQPQTRLPSHCDRLKTPGIDVSTGSLGQGLSEAAGIALGFLQDKMSNSVFCIVGDGECQEGQVWEAAMFAAHNHLGNLTLFVDANKQQLDGSIKEINDISNFAERFAAFGWDVQEIDGHDYSAIHEAIAAARSETSKPSAIILNTVKGKGCSFAEGKFNHHINVSAQEAEEAMAVLQAKLDAYDKEAK